MDALDPRHGKYAGAKAHKKAGEEPCEPCRLARNEYALARKRLKCPRSRRIADRLEDLMWMAETGESASGAARRLDISLDALDKWCRNNDAVNLWHRLRSHEPELNRTYCSNQWSAA